MLFPSIFPSHLRTISDFDMGPKAIRREIIFTHTGRWKSRVAYHITGKVTLPDLGQLENARKPTVEVTFNVKLHYFMHIM